MPLKEKSEIPLQLLQVLRHVSLTCLGVEPSQKPLSAQFKSHEEAKSEHVIPLGKSHLGGKEASWHATPKK